MDMSAEQRRQAFSCWLRSGRSPRFVSDDRKLELKFNPWHDPEDGRFTFAGQGNYFEGEGAAPSKPRGQDAPILVESADEPSITTLQEADAWKARLLAKYGHLPGYAEAIEAQYQRYKNNLPQQNAPLQQLADFGAGFGKGIYEVGRDTVTGIYSIFTTNPLVTIKNIEFGLAGTIDAALAAEDTPAYIQVDRAAKSIANASAHDWGYVAGKISGNIGLGAASKVAFTKFAAVVRVAEVDGALLAESAPDIAWVDEAPLKKGLPKDYNDSAMGARSNVRTRRNQVPALKMTMPDGTTRLVKFDGVDGNVMIDRKWSITRYLKAKAQALRQSEVLGEHGLLGRWEVPTEAKRRKAVKLLEELNITNIEVRVVSHGKR